MLNPNRAAQLQFEGRAGQLAERAKEMEAVLEQRRSELEAEYAKKEKETGERERKKMEADIRHRQLEAEAALAAKEQSLLEAHRLREMRLQEEWLRKGNEQQEEFNRRKLQLLAEQEKAAEAEKGILKAQLEQEARKLDDSYRSRVAEIERMQQTLEEQFRTWKATVVDEYLQKEKNLDKQWHVHEQELVRKYEIALEQERRTAQFEAARTREQFEQLRKRLEDEYYQKSLGLKEKQDAAIAERAAVWTKAEADLQAKHQADLQELRERQRQSMLQQAKHFESELGRVEDSWKSSAAQTREKHEAEKVELERQILEAQSQIKELQEKAARAQGEEAKRRAGFEAERAMLEAQYLERGKELEARIRLREEDLKRERHRLMGELKHKEEIMRQNVQREHSETLEHELRAREAEWLNREQAAQDAFRMKEERLKAQAEKREEFLKTEQTQREADLIAEYELRLEKEKRRLAEIEKAMAERLKERNQDLERESKSLLAQKEASLLQRNQDILARERARLESEYAEKLKAAERAKRESK